MRTLSCPAGRQGQCCKHCNSGQASRPHRRRVALCRGRGRIRRRRGRWRSGSLRCRLRRRAGQGGHLRRTVDVEVRRLCAGPGVQRHRMAWQRTRQHRWQHRHRRQHLHDQAEHAQLHLIAGRLSGARRGPRERPVLGSQLCRTGGARAGLRGACTLQCRHVEGHRRADERRWGRGCVEGCRSHCHLAGGHHAERCQQHGGCRVHCCRQGERCGLPRHLEASKQTRSRLCCLSFAPLPSACAKLARALRGPASVAACVASSAGDVGCLLRRCWLLL